MSAVSPQPASERPPPVNDPALPLLSEVRFREDDRCFTAGQVLTFRHGVNLLVGEQGCGKSTSSRSCATLSARSSRWSASTASSTS